MISLKEVRGYDRFLLELERGTGLIFDSFAITGGSMRAFVRQGIEFCRDRNNVIAVFPPQTILARSDYVSMRLSDLDVVQGRGERFVSANKSAIKEAYLNGLLQALSRVFQVPWDSAYLQVHRDQSMPMEIVARPVECLISPVTSVQ